MYKKKSGVTLAAVVGLMLMAALVLFGGIGKIKSSGSLANKSLDQLADAVPYSTAEKVMGQVSVGETSLYDELPEITKYPLQVQGNGQIDIEIFASGEKAGSGTDGWLVECAQSFNADGRTLPDGRSVSMSVRSVGSGLGADYILSGKALPDLYTPSNVLFPEYAIANGAPMELLAERLVGNTAGILVKKSLDYKSVDQVLSAVMAGELHLGYTNPQNSATGANLLVYVLQENGGVDSDQSKTALKAFNANVPFIAYTTQQMVTSAASGSFDAIVSEYQAYVNDRNLTSLYDFIPFGLRHDNPMYVTGRALSDSARKAACDMIVEYLATKPCQDLASKYGFNAMNDYDSAYSTYGAEVGRALQTYKQAKDAGRDIVAMFVADCSGSMIGDGIAQLKASLSNGAQYINENNLIGLISYDTNVTVELPIARFDMNQKAYFQGAVDRMQAGSETYTYEALCVALKMVREEMESHPDAKPMVFLLSDGNASGRYEIGTVSNAIHETGIPIYTIAYTDNADTAELSQLSNINEAASISADSDDVTYKIKSLFNAQL